MTVKNIKCSAYSQTSWCIYPSPLTLERVEDLDEGNLARLPDRDGIFGGGVRIGGLTLVGRKRETHGLSLSRGGFERGNIALGECQCIGVVAVCIEKLHK